MNMILKKTPRQFAPKKRLTVHEYELMPTNGNVLQLIDGDFIMTPAPLLKHQEVSRNIQEYFLDYLKKYPVGKILDAPVDYHIDKYNVVQPDLAYIAKDRYSILFEKGIKDAPDLIVEILSPHTQKMDREAKKELYWKVGVKEYWIVDIDHESIEVFHYSSETFQLEKIYRNTQDHVLKCQLLPELTLDLKRIFFFDWLPG